MESVDKLREWSRRYDFHWIDPKTEEMITFYPMDCEGRPSGKNERFSVNEGERMRELLDEIEREHEREVEEARMNAIYLPSRRVALPLDRDGMPIDIGDEVYHVDMPERHSPVESITLTEDGWMVDDDCKPSELRHWEAPTVEVLLKQLVFEATDIDAMNVTAMAALAGDYVERIREAVEHEEDK